MVQQRVAPMSLSELQGPGEWTEMNLTNLDLRSFFQIPTYIHSILARPDVSCLQGYQEWLKIFSGICASAPALEMEVNQLHSTHVTKQGKAITDQEKFDVMVIGANYMTMRTKIDEAITIPAISIISAVNEHMPIENRIRLEA